MMVYVEYISRRPGIDLADFHATFKSVQEGWESSFAEDQMILGAARTWRLGPEPEYLAIWYLPNSDFDRIDEWDKIFSARNSESYGLNSPLRRVARIDHAGCYTPLMTPVRVREGIYYAEMFRPVRSNSEICNFFEERLRAHAKCHLIALLRRIGLLAPAPGGLAIWIVPNFAYLGEIAQDLEGVSQPLEPVQAGVYVDVGKEVV